MSGHKGLRPVSQLVLYDQAYMPLYLVIPFIVVIIHGGKIIFMVRKLQLAVVEFCNKGHEAAALHPGFSIIIKNG